jgi:flavodoxin/NAD-dependent dihydropyrimidine dehydrogenase PreA subunit
MKIGIYYFSGTGNTRFVANQIEKYYENLGENVSTFSIEEGTLVEDTDLIIIGSPIYAGNVPEKLIRWVLRNIPDTDQSKAITFTTSAGLQNAFGTGSIATKLSKKGYKILGQLKYELPRNYYFKKYEMQSKEQSYKLFKNVKTLIPNDLEKISNEDGDYFKTKTLGIDLLAETMSVMTRFMGKSFSVNSNCTKCKKCIKSCPTKNIVLKSKISFKLNCMMCTRCIHNCPENAITYKGKNITQSKTSISI